MDPISKHTHTDVNPQTKLQMVALSKECDSGGLFLCVSVRVCVCVCLCVCVRLSQFHYALFFFFFVRFSPDCIVSEQGT